MEVLQMCKNELCAGLKNNMTTVEKINDDSVRRESKYFWAEPYKCNICGAIYYSCIICKKEEHKATLYKKSRLARHNAMHIDYNHNNEKYDMKRKMNDTVFTKQSLMKIDPVVNEGTFDRPESFKYFEFNEMKGDGAAYLVGNAMCGTSNVYDHMDSDDITLHLLVAKFVKTLSRIQRVEFAFIMEMLLNHYEKHKSVNEKNMPTTTEMYVVEAKNNNEVSNVIKGPMDNSSQLVLMQQKKRNLRVFFPTTDADIRNRYIIGKNSIVSNLPRPKIEIYHDHSYVSIRQCIAHFLACGNDAKPVEKLLPKTKRFITDSKIAHDIARRGYAVNKDIARNDVIILLGLQWSDAFDPNSSTKSNRGAVWIKTVTFVSDRFENNNIHDTFPIAIGLKSNNHDAIERRFVEELLELGSGINNTFYSSIRKRYVTVHFELVASLGDQPERREINYLIGGNSKFGSHYLYSANIEALVNVLPPCSSCTEQLQNNPTFLKSKFSCDSCLLWDHSRRCNMTEYNPPPEYPKEALQSNGKLKTMELTFDILNAVVEFASHKFEHGEWTEKQLCSYMTVHGVNRSGCSKIIDHCHNKMTHEILRKDLSLAQGNLLTLDYQNDSSKYSHWSGGPFWKSNLGLHQFVDVLMHLVFLGVTKSTREIVLNWISETKRMHGYRKFGNSIFHHITEMSLEWCKLIVANSGWVSDNYIAFARVCKWFYYPIILLNNKAEYKEPIVPINTWYAKMCKDWLVAHGYSTDGNINEMRHRIKEHKKDKANPPMILQSRSCPSQDITNLIGSLVSMVATIMNKEVTDEHINIVDREVRIFLTYLNKIQQSSQTEDNKGRKTKSKPYWLSRYNHLSLLNIPKHMRNFGPILNLWEGSNQGEGYLRFVKPKLKNIHSKNWQLNAHCEIFNEISLEQVFQNHVHKNYSKERCCSFQNVINSRMNRPKKMFMRYKSVNEVFSSFRKNRPISAVRCYDNKFYAVVQKQQHKVHAIQINLQYFKTISPLSMHFHKVKMNLVLTDSELQPFDECYISNYILLLPELDKEGYINIQGNGSYYVIDSEWNELGCDMKLISPKSPNCIY